MKNGLYLFYLLNWYVESSTYEENKAGANGGDAITTIVLTVTPFF